MDFLGSTFRKFSLVSNVGSFRFVCYHNKYILNFIGEVLLLLLKRLNGLKVAGIQVNFGFQVDQLSLMMVMIIHGESGH